MAIRYLYALTVTLPNSSSQDHLVCFLSGTLVLGKLYAGQPEEHLQIAKVRYQMGGTVCRDIDWL